MEGDQGTKMVACDLSKGCWDHIPEKNGREDMKPEKPGGSGMVPRAYPPWKCGAREEKMLQKKKWESRSVFGREAISPNLDAFH